MYVNRYRSDVSEVSWRDDEAGPWRTEPVLSFHGAEARALRLGRTEISMHNTSAPDLVFYGFR
jgi:hypothetical protein